MWILIGVISATSNYFLHLHRDVHLKSATAIHENNFHFSETDPHIKPD